MEFAMEKSNDIIVSEASFDWNDLGSWDALETIINKTEGNTLVSNNSKYYFENSSGNIISTPPEQLVTLIDVNDMIIINENNALVVLPKKEAQKIKNIVTHLKSVYWGDDHL